MKQEYKDILSRIKEEPIWFDENGCPRYDPFHPDLCAEFYAHEAALILIACQACEKQVKVAVTYSNFSCEEPLSKEINHISYGDPPRGCCDVGATMSSDTIQILEFWRNGFHWVRLPELEIKISQDSY